MSEKIVLREITYEQMSTLVTELKIDNFIKDKEIERLNNIINELEKDFKKESNELKNKLFEISITANDIDIVLLRNKLDCYENILEKIQELKGDGSNE